MKKIFSKKIREFHKLTSTNSLKNFDSTKFNHLVPPDLHTEKYKKELNSCYKIDYDYDTKKFVDKSAIISLTLNHSEIQNIVKKFEALRNCPKS